MIEATRVYLPYGRAFTSAIASPNPPNLYLALIDAVEGQHPSSSFCSKG